MYSSFVDSINSVMCKNQTDDVLENDEVTILIKYTYLYAWVYTKSLKVLDFIQGIFKQISQWVGGISVM